MTIVNGLRYLNSAKYLATVIISLYYIYIVYVGRYVTKAFLIG